MVLVELFTDPWLRGPVLGTLLIAAASALFGLFAFVRREALAGEAIAHSAYPGITIAALATGLTGGSESLFGLLVLLGAFACGALALRFAQMLRRRPRISGDSALCFVLTGLFSVGMLIASATQNLFPYWGRQTMAYLFGQIVLMDTLHVWIGTGLVAVAALYALFFYKPAALGAFDPNYACVLGVRTKSSEWAYQLGLAAIVVAAVKSVGVVLLSGLLIAPALAARQCTRRFVHMLWIAPLIGLCAALFGMLLSIGFETPVPPGPIIVLALTLSALAAHIFAPREGLLAKVWRRYAFRTRCLDENILKVLWKVLGCQDVCEPGGIDGFGLRALHLGPKWATRRALNRLVRRGQLERIHGRIALTEAGAQRAARIVRLHRLWEAYLASQLDVSTTRVHTSAEEIEHILMPELEEQLEQLVDADYDPHNQRIPQREEDIPKQSEELQI